MAGSGPSSAAEHHTCSLAPTPRHVLIEQRLTVLLMRAVPAEIRAELVAVRAVSSLAVVVAVLCRYQPGGPNERATVLAFLVAPDRPTSIDTGIATCRRWLRQLQRAKELGLMLPDATLLIKGADALLGPVLTKSQQASFRLNSFRNERKLDYAPAFDSIVAFGQLILAEYELLQHSEPGEPKRPKINKAVEGEEEGPPKGGKGKQGKGPGADLGNGKGAKGSSASSTDPPPNKPGKAVCKYWCITDLGCVKASRCPDAHNKDLLRGTSRCWVCSSTQHRKQDCPRNLKENPEDAPAKGKGNKTRPEPKVKVAKEEEVTPTLAPSAQQLLQDTAALLKNLRVSKIREGRLSLRALLDSGATACMRTAKEGEMQGLPERVVQLAQGEVRLRVNPGGTLLTEQQVDPIISLHRLCQIGYRMEWSRESGCKVSSPGRKALRVYTDNGCPEVDQQAGLELIREIEAFQVRNAQALKVLREGSRNEVSLKEALQALPVDPSAALAWLSRKFPSLPQDVLARIPVAASYDASRVAWNRRQRRTWLRSGGVALHLFSGPEKKFWEVPRSNSHCICVDVKENLLDDQTYAFLQELALTGRLGAVFGGPPCRSFSLSRYMPPELPRPLRGRTPDTQWGWDSLTPNEREVVITDGILMFRMVWLYIIAEAVALDLQLPKPFFGLEHPKDPETWVCPEDLGIQVPEQGLASCWALDAIKDFAEEHKLHFWHFDQGPLGHEKRKPTTLLSSVPAPPDVLVSGPGHGRSAPPALGTQGSGSPWPSSAWSAWAPGLKDILKREVLSVLDAWTSDRCRTLREQENFLQHVVQGHVDFRRDCSACLAGAARGARHDRRSVHDAWVLHMDLMGPFLEGADEHGRVKYVLTGVLTVPDYSVVSQAVQVSEDVASGESRAAVSSSMSSGMGVKGREHDRVPKPPLSTLGPPVFTPLEPLAETDCEDYELSECEAVPGGEEGQEDVMAVQPEESEPPESTAEAQAVASANRRWMEAASALQLQECRTIEIPFVRMLPNKCQQTVVQALAAMLAQIQYEGFMVRRVHSDRGREFNNSGVRRLCAQRDVYQTFTQGDDPKQNGRVEGFHARLKGKTRTLLLGSKAQPSDWPYAMRTAHAALLASALRRFGREVPPPLPFGTTVRVRTRTWERDLWSERVQEAVVLAPSIETCKGHVVRTSSGTLLHTTAVFKGTIQVVPQPVGVSSVPLAGQARVAPVPCSGPAGPEVHISFPSASTPSRRIVGKQSPQPCRAAKLRGAGPSDAQALSAAAAAMLSHCPVPFRTSAALLVSAPVLREHARALPLRLGAGESSGYLLFGWYKHGGLTGVSAITSVLPGVVQLLNALLAQAHPDGTWTTLGLFFSAVADPHVDRRNTKGTCNYVLPLALPPTEQYIWVQNPLGIDLDPLTWCGRDGQVYPGFRLPLRVAVPASVDPHSLHALPAPLSHEAQQPHVLLVGFSVPWLHRASESQRQQLQSLGFRLESSRGGVGDVTSRDATSMAAAAAADAKEKVCSAVKQEETLEEYGPGLLENCLVAEGHLHIESTTRRSPASQDCLQEDVQDDTAGEGSVTGRGVYARRLEARVFEPADWDRVRQYLIDLGLEHLIGPIDALGVDSLEDFEFLYREDLMEAGATKEEAEAILECTGAAREGRAEPPPMARAGHHRPSRPAAQGFQGPAVAARLVHANDRANRVPNAAQGAPGPGVGQGAFHAGALQGAVQGALGPGAGQGAAQGAPGPGVGQGAFHAGALQGTAQGALGPGALQGAAQGASGPGVGQGAFHAGALQGAAQGASGPGVGQGAFHAGALQGAAQGATGPGVGQGASHASAVQGVAQGGTGPGVGQGALLARAEQGEAQGAFHEITAQGAAGTDVIWHQCV